MAAPATSEAGAAAGGGWLASHSERPGEGSGQVGEERGQPARLSPAALGGGELFCREPLPTPAQPAPAAPHSAQAAGEGGRKEPAVNGRGSRVTSWSTDG